MPETVTSSAEAAPRIPACIMEIITAHGVIADEYPLLAKYLRKLLEGKPVYDVSLQRDHPALQHELLFAFGEEEATKLFEIAQKNRVTELCAKAIKEAASVEDICSFCWNNEQTPTPPFQFNPDDPVQILHGFGRHIANLLAAERATTATQ